MQLTYQKTMNVETPSRAHNTDAGLDLYVPEGQTCLVRRGAVYTIDLGVRVAIPDGYYGQLTLRSSAGQKGLTMPHGVGIIDSGYRGNLKVAVTTLTEPVLIAAGDRICQLVILPQPSVEVEAGIVDDNTERSQGGFGSTGQSADAPDDDDNEEAKVKRDDRVDLTVGSLMRELQEIAFRYGNDAPIVIPTTEDADYEQATAPIIMHAKREEVPDDWDFFDIDPNGEAVVVIS